MVVVVVVVDMHGLMRGGGAECLCDDLWRCCTGSTAPLPRSQLNLKLHAYHSPPLSHPSLS